MRILLTNGTIIEAGLRMADNRYELRILTPEKIEIVIDMNPDEFKWFALDVHKLANQSV